MARTLEAEKTACAKSWVPGKRCMFQKNAMWLEFEVHGEKYTWLGSHKLYKLCGLQRTSRNL